MRQLKTFALSLRLFCLFTSLLFLPFSCSRQEKIPTFPIPVTAWKVIPETIPVNYEYVGFAQSSHLVQIRARVEGYLDEIAYKEGSPVKKGQLLFQIDPRPFQAALDKAKGELARTKAALWDAKQTRQRLEPLYEKKAASKRDLDNATARELEAQAQVDAASAQVVTAELNLSWTKIESPVDALSGNAAFREGALISPGPNSLLTTLYVVNPIWVLFSVPESDILNLREEVKYKRVILPPDRRFKVEAILSNGQRVPSTGYVDFTDPSYNQNTGTMNIRAVFENPNILLRPGQFVRGIVTGATRPNAIYVPQESVLQGSKGMFVYVVDKEGTAQMRTVQPGSWYGNYWVIKSGLHAGDLVIADGVNKVQQDKTVHVTKIINE